MTQIAVTKTITEIGVRGVKEVTSGNMMINHTAWEAILRGENKQDGVEWELRGKKLVVGTEVNLVGTEVKLVPVEVEMTTEQLRKAYKKLHGKFPSKTWKNETIKAKL